VEFYIHYTYTPSKHAQRKLYLLPSGADINFPLNECELAIALQGVCEKNWVQHSSYTYNDEGQAVNFQATNSNYSGVPVRRKVLLEINGWTAAPAT
jgi:hypothetical protein